MTGFTLRGEITDVEIIAVGKAVQVRSKLVKAYGPRSVAEAQGYRVSGTA